MTYPCVQNFHYLLLRYSYII